MHLLSTFAAGVVFLGTIQSLSGDDIVRQLDSAAAVTAAWGAYNAAAYHREDMIPRLQQLLETPPALEPQERYAFLDVVMDALIQLNAKIPASSVAPHIDERPVQACVLLANGTERQDALLGVLPRLSGDAWFAAADMLFEDRAPGLIVELVRRLRLGLTIYVVDLADRGAGVGSGSAGIAVSDGIGQNPRGYPPHAQYRFEPTRSGAVVLTAGPHPVYYSRTVTRAFQYPVSMVTVSGPDNDDRLAYLHAMAGAAADTLRAETSESVGWTTADALVARARELRGQLIRRVQYLVDLAGRFRPLPVGLVIDPPVDVRLVDRRSDHTVPLPRIEK